MKKVKDVLDELNKRDGDGVWVSSTGGHALTKVTKEGESFSFNPASGVVVKVFFNQKTGEIRLYPAGMFDDAF